MSTRALTPLGVLVASADPATPTLRAGDLYFNSGTLKLRTYTGALWVDVDATVASTTVSSETGWGVLANAGSSTSLSKGDHTHGTPTLPVTAASGGNQITLGANQTGSITIAVTTTPTFTSLASSGMTGAVAATRYAGGTSAGAPTSGTFITGDWIIAQAGALWICTAGGTPGTWVAPGGVTSVNGGTNVSVSPTTGAVVVSLSATPVFTSVTANASSTNGFRFSTGGTPAIYENFGVSISGDTTHPVQVMSTALLVGQTAASGGSYTAGDVVATRLFEGTQRAHSQNFGFATTVTGGSGFGQASVVGSLFTYAREDHQHSTHAALNAGDIAQGTFGTTGGQYNMPSLFMMTASATATSGNQSPSSWQLGFTASYWTGAAAANATGNISMNANNSGVTTGTLGFGVTTTSGVLQENGIRVFSQTFGAATTSVATTTFGLSAVLGTVGAGWARGDHTHGTPSLSSSAPTTVGVLALAGSVGTASDSGHQHIGVSSIAGSTGIAFSSSSGTVTASISGLTMAQVGAGTTSANYTFSGTVNFTGTTMIGNKSLWSGTRTLPGSANTVDLGTFSSFTGAFQVNLMLTVDNVSGFAVTKSYEIDVTGSVGVLSTWYRVVPSDSSQNETLSGNDFLLEVQRTAVNVYAFRIRQVGSIGGTLYWQGEGYGSNGLSFTASTATTSLPTSPTQMWSPTVLFEGPGVAGVNNPNPQYAFDVTGSSNASSQVLEQGVRVYSPNNPDTASQARLTNLEINPAYAGTNLEPDGGYESANPSALYSSFFNDHGIGSYQTSVKRSGSTAHRSTISTTTGYLRLGTITAIPVNPGDTIESIYYAYQESGTATAELAIITSDTAGGADYFGTNAIQQGVATVALTTGAWVKVVARATVPAGHYYMRTYNSIQASTVCVVSMDDRVTRRIAYDPAASGSGVLVQAPASTVTVLPTNGTIATVSGATYTVPVGGAGTYDVEMICDFQSTVTGDEAIIARCTLYIGASPASGAAQVLYRSGVASARATVSQSNVITLADGDVLTMRVDKTAAANGNSQANATHTKLIITSAKGSQGSAGLTGTTGATGPAGNGGVLTSGSVATNTTATTAGAIPGAATTIATNTVTVTAGRRYKITTNFFGFTATSVATDERYTLSYTTSGATVAVVGPNNMTFWTKVSQGVQPGLVHVAYYTCSIGGSLTINETLTHAGGTSTTITCAANGGLMVIEDVGT